MGDPKILAGGEAIKYGAMVIVDFRKRSVQETDPIKREDGVKIGVTVKKNHVVHGRNPYQKTVYYGVYGEGTETVLEVIELAINQGILAKAGAFIRIPDEDGQAKIIDGEKMQWQGMAKFKQYCSENPEFFKDLKAQVKGESVRMSGEEVAQAVKETGVGTEMERECMEIIQDISNKKKKKAKKEQEA